MKKVLVLFIVIAFAGLSAFAQKDENNRIKNSGKVMTEILNVPDDIPKDLLDKAECVIVLPSVLKFAIGFGGSYGRGVMTCRGGEDFSGPWSAPAMMALEGGSFGLQLGGQATDFVLLVMNQRGADSIYHLAVVQAARDDCVGTLCTPEQTVSLAIHHDLLGRIEIDVLRELRQPLDFARGISR